VPRHAARAGQPPRHGARGGRPSGDLGAVRGSDALIELLAARRRLRARALRDPAVALLSSLTADVDAAPRRAAPGSDRTRRDGAWRLDGARAGGAWPHAAAAAAVAAAIATVAAVAAAVLVAVGMLARLSGPRGWDRPRRR